MVTAQVKPKAKAAENQKTLSLEQIFERTILHFLEPVGEYLRDPTVTDVNLVEHALEPSGSGLGRWESQSRRSAKAQSAKSNSRDREKTKEPERVRSFIYWLTASAFAPSPGSRAGATNMSWFPFCSHCVMHPESSCVPAADARRFL